MTESKKLRVLLADDDGDDREIFVKAMSEVSALVNVATASDGIKLMKELESSAAGPDLIFLDLNMPLKNGLECLAEIRSNSNLAEIPVVIYSTSMSPQEVESAWSLGARCFVRKPDSYKLLKDILAKLINLDFNILQRQSREKFIFNL